MQQQTLDRMYEAYLASRVVSTDTRSIVPGCLFFAFKGEHFDGNAFAAQALESGAALCVIDDERYRVDERCIVVGDVLQALQELAGLHRSRLAMPVVGITGTNGKTTTKELVRAVLSRRYRTSATEGNHNNHIGVPLTLLAIPQRAEIAVVEMGANHPGEIEALCNIADPDCGLITNVGRAHLEGFGSLEGVVQTKTELYRHLAAKHGLLFVDADNERLMAEARRLTKGGSTAVTVVAYGSTAGCDVRGTLVEGDKAETPYMHFYFEVGDNVYNVRTQLLGDYNFSNCMAAVAVGLHFGVEPFDIKEAIEDYKPQNNRSQWVDTGRNHLYLDCYNANPSSMRAAVASFGKIGGRKMAILGGMRELGQESVAEHERLVVAVEAQHWERVMLVGKEFDGLALPKGFERYANADAVADAVRREPIEGCAVLVKGSNGNRLWVLQELL